MTCGHARADRTWNGRPVCARCWGRAVDALAPVTLPAAELEALRVDAAVGALALLFSERRAVSRDRVAPLLVEISLEELVDRS